MVSHRSTLIALSVTAIVAACAKTEKAADTTAADTSTMASSTTATTSPPATVNLADVAGKWNMKSVPTTGDTTPTTYVLNAKSTTDGWSFNFPGRAPVPVKVTVDGDSIMLSAGPYASVRRKGLQVTTNGVARVQGGHMSGTTTAHYKTKSADSVMTLTTSGDKAP